jgi:amidase
VDELAFAPALELAARVRAKEVSPRELVELYRGRIDRLDPQLNAFVTLAEDPEPAADGPFFGVPLPVKDLTETAGLRTTYSCKAFADNVPDADASVVRKLRAAGFTIIGKTNTPEFGTIAMTESELNGDCRNPWDTGRTSGGSSGGAAAAVAAGLAPLAHGSDGGGSIRIPSSCCGLFGIKPSRGRISPAPYVSGSLGLGTSGPIARTVRDAAALLDVMTGNEPGDMYVAPRPERRFLDEADQPPGRLRIAVTTDPPIAVPVDPVCAGAARDAGELLSELGHDVVDRSPPWQTDEMIAHFIRVWQTGPATAGVDDLSLLEPINRMLAEDARATSSQQYVSSLMQLQQHVRRVLPFWDVVDAVLTPTLGLTPVPIGWTWADADGDPYRAFASQWLWTPFTALVNVTGQPAISVPLHWTDGGLPIGVQLIGRPFAEATLIRLAAQLEGARPWADRRPPVS